MRLALPAGLSNPLGKRLVGLLLVRLSVLGLLLLIIVLYYLRELELGGFSINFAVATVATAFLASAASTLWMRAGKRLTALAHTQLVLDQLTWTAVVYVSGGVTSGSTSLYGLTCLFGVVLLGTPGAVNSAVVGMMGYLSLALAFAYGVVTPPPDQPAGGYVVDGQAMVYPVFSTLMATGLVAMLAMYLSERLRAFGGRLEEATKRAEQAERLAALGKLAAGLAHEIRNPLGSIQGSIELLRTGGTLDDEDVHLCRIIEREAARLNDLVTDMVDLSRPREPALQPTDLASLAQAVVELARSAGGNEQVIRYDGPEELIAVVDGGQMRQVLWNLVRNAMQASSARDEIRVSLRREKGSALLEVSDHGRGIPASDLDRVFDAFYTTRSHGVGIGLAVVKQVTESHGFPLDVTSEEGVGTRFSMRVPKDALVAGLLACLCLLGLAPATLGCSAGNDWVRSERAADDAMAADDGWSDEAAAGGDAGHGGGALPASTVAATATARQAPAAPKHNPHSADPGSTSSANPSGSASAVRVSLRGHPAPAGGDAGEPFRNTYYDFPDEAAFGSSQGTRVVYDASCSPIATVKAGFHDQLCVQGSGKLLSGHTVSFAKRGCSCAHECPRTGQQICFERLDNARFPHGRGAMGTAITPMRSVAVDPAVIPLGTVLYIPAYHGLRDARGKAHDGCFIAEDRGLKVRGRHVDIFTGSPATTRTWNTAVPSNVGVRVLLSAARCRHLTTR